MTEAVTFAKRIREHYPEGLTGILALGGTRTAYILGQNRNAADPGRIPSMEEYARYGLQFLKEIISAFFELGGQNLVVSVLSYQQMNDARGADYTKASAELCSILMNDEWSSFYRAEDADPYFAGVDTLLHLPANTVGHDLGAACASFNRHWSYQPGHRKIVWEIAPIPLFSFWRAQTVQDDDVTAALNQQLAQAVDLQTIHDLLYEYYAYAAYGTSLPKPHFYIGTNRKADLKLRSMLPISLLCGDDCRLFYVPYPSLFMKRETLQAILEDLAFGKPLRSTKMDYSGQITSEMINAEYARVQELSADPSTTLGLTHRIQVDE